MLEPPVGVADAEVLVAVRRHSGGAQAVSYLPIGFGAHHWCASLGGEPRLFVTLDALGRRHSASSLEGAYAAAAHLELDFVWRRSRPSRVGTRWRWATGG